MSAIKLTLVLIVLGMFALIVLLMIRGERKRRAKRIARAEQLGFLPLAEVPSSIQRRVDWLHTHRAKQKLELRNLATLERGDHSLFLFDLVDVGGDESSTLQGDAMLVVSSDLTLPRFTMMTKIQQAGILAEWANKAIQSLVERRGYQPIRLRDPGIQDRFLVFSDDPTQTASFFERVSFPISRQISYVSIEAGGDAFTFGTIPLPSSGQSTFDSLESSMREAEQWFRLFLRATN